MDAQPSPQSGRRARRVRALLLAAWVAGVLAGSAGLLITMASFGTARLHPAWEAIFGVGFWTMLLTPAAIVIWAVSQFTRRRDTTQSHHHADRPGGRGRF